ncbi:MAG: tRNA (guanosine(37)-N1)-methyltransferase TrmD [Deltaproteobacteria bacterium]|nr:tRNA (guanosine(37)-N1)-methyltransferase TrmD [Deltaproteobacteria bacterium]
MKVEIITIFPELFSGFLSSSLVAKAQEKNLLTISTLNIRDFADAPHYHVDDTPYGGGAGMLMKPEPLCRAIEDSKSRLPSAKVILLSASGETFTQRKALELSHCSEIILVCGRYEGIDQRVIDLLVDEEISIGDYVLMGGEVPAMVLIEACTRLVSGVVGNEESIETESFRSTDESAQLEAPQYTRPAEFRGHKVPEVLLSGNHKKIAEWRLQESKKLTSKRRKTAAQRNTP